MLRTFMQTPKLNPNPNREVVYERDQLKSYIY